MNLEDAQNDEFGIPVPAVMNKIIERYAPMAEEEAVEEEVHYDVQEVYEIIVNGGDNALLVKNGLNHHFEDEKGGHISVHIWRFR